ncbi:MAG: hypothetical protein WBA39_26140 [Rivularia sp. (in: cyanobacteria)]
MISLKKIILGTAAIGISFGSIINFQQPAEAGFFKDLDPTNKNSIIRKTGRRIDPTNPNGYVGRDLHAKFKLCNNTSATVRYSLGSRRAALSPKSCVKWTTTGQTPLSFDKASRRGYQRQTYNLNDGQYFFQEVRWVKSGWGIDLKKK